MVTWDENVNFASALLLHSCLTVFIKETLNLVSVLWHHGYTSVLSNDGHADLAELYFTNTGLALLSVSLASAIAINLSLSDAVLNVFVACTFGFCFLVSVLSCRSSSWLRVVLALHRAGRFVWSDTPFVNFFSLIYVAVVLKSSSTMRLKDYITLRSIAILELVFMKAYIAAASTDGQTELLRSLRKSQLVLFQTKQGRNLDISRLPHLERDSIVLFTTAQRMAVMFFKTAVSYDLGSVRGPRGPASIPVPPVGFLAHGDAGSDEWRVYRLRDDAMLIADVPCPRRTPPDAKSAWGKLARRLHGIFLKQLGKVRVVYLPREEDDKVLAVRWRPRLRLGSRT